MNISILRHIVAVATIVFSIQTISLAQIETQVYVPPSALVFHNLDSLSKAQVNWKSLPTFNKRSNYANKYTIALNLGTRICDAFVAIQAKEQNKFADMATTVASLSSKLNANIEQSLNDKMFALVKQGKWSEVRSMLDDQQNTVKEKLNRLDKDAAVLVTIGGWLEALHVVTKSLSSNYVADATSVIRNPKLVEYLIGEMNGLTTQAKNNDLVKSITARLPEIKALVNLEKGTPVPHENIKKLFEISSVLVKSVEGAK
ncbi:MAG: hypothetical protein RML40_00845 [Bacteroidota bacterium]|nr:hypothetical protein [Candidatus Kapabacteria bacterium]MDW8219054.1 hypothetical protein [Bacteroidota bacterium]